MYDIPDCGLRGCIKVRVESITAIDDEAHSDDKEERRGILFDQQVRAMNTKSFMATKGKATQTNSRTRPEIVDG